MQLATAQPESDSEKLRWQYCYEARSILYGKWAALLAREITEAVGAVRGNVWKVVDISANPLKSTSNQLARTYDATPLVHHADALGVEFSKIIEEETPLWMMRGRIQRDTIALKETLTAIEIVDGELCFRQVFADLVEVEGYAHQPHRIKKLAELRKRDGVQVWDVWDLSDATPSFRIMSADRKQDLTKAFLGATFEGDSYIWRIGDKPLIPYVIHHSAWANTMFDWQDNIELITGVKMLGVYYSFFGHALRNASWEQRYIANARVQGSDEQSHVVADPAAILALESISELSPQVGSWSATIDFGQMLESIRTYEGRLAAHVGINSSDLMRMSGDPRSGYAVSVSRESQRELMRRMEPFSKAADKEIFKIAAALLGTATGKAYPTTGYDITYQGIPQSQAERKATREEIYGELDRGLLTREMAYMRINPAATMEEAATVLALAQPAVGATTAAPDDGTAQPADTATEEPTDGPAPSTVLNGAQVTSAVDIVSMASRGELSTTTASSMLQLFFKLSPQDAASLLR